MINPKLYTCLANIMGIVGRSNLNDNTYFWMDQYDSCVIGRTIGWKHDTSFDIEVGVLNLFGIDRFNDDQATQYTPPYFSSESGDLYSEEEWSVISLFTNYHGNSFTRRAWLDLAHYTMRKLLVKDSKLVRVFGTDPLMHDGINLAELTMFFVASNGLIFDKYFKVLSDVPLESDARLIKCNFATMVDGDEVDYKTFLDATHEIAFYKGKEAYDNQLILKIYYAFMRALDEVNI